MTPQEFIKAVCREYQITPKELRGKSRTRPLPQIRHAAAATIHRHFPELTLQQIGKLIGRHHAMVIYGVRISQNQQDVALHPIVERMRDIIQPKDKMKFNDSNTVTQ